MRRPGLITLLITLLACCQGFPANAQETSSIAGRAIWRWEIGLGTRGGAGQVTTMDMPVQVRATLTTATDTLRTESTAAGSFRFRGLRPGPVHLLLESKGYQPFSEHFELVPGENVVLVEMKKEEDVPPPSEELDPASVEAEGRIATMKGDTLVYNATMLALQEGDYAIDLLKQMPGVEVKDRQILVTGKAVRRTYVNGALIFGLDPMAGMENLRGEQVTQFYVYDEANPMDRQDGQVREKQRVIDIRTKDPIFSVTDIQFKAIGGADWQKREDGSLQGRYAFGFNGKYFSELRQLRTDVITDNLGMMSSLMYASPQVQSRYTENTAANLAYERYWSSPLFGDGIQLDYRYDGNWSKGWSRALTEYFETAGVPARTVENRSEDERFNRTHTLTTTAAYRTNPHFRLTWNSLVNLTDGRGSSLSQGATTVAGGMPMGRNERTHSDTDAWRIEETLTMGLSKGNFRPNLRLELLMSNDKADGWTLDTLASSYARRYLTKAGKGISRQYSATLTHPVYIRSTPQGGFSLSAGYGLSYRNAKRTQAAFDLFDVPEPRPNAANTYDYTDSGVRQNFDLRGNLSTRRQRYFSLQYGLSFVADRMVDDERIPSVTSVRKTFYSILPSLMLQFNGKATIQYSSSAILPSVEQLRARVDDTNPLFVVAGNPDLKRSVTHALTLFTGSAGLSSEQIQSGRYRTMYVNASVSLTTRPVISRTDVYTAAADLPAYTYTVPAGASVRTWENADYRLSASASLNWSNRLKVFGGRRTISLTARPSLNFNLSPAYYGSVLDRNVEWVPGLNLSASTRVANRITLNLKADEAYTRSRSTGGTMDMQAWRSSLGADMQVSFLKNGVFQADYAWTFSRNLTRSSLDMDIHRLNASVGIDVLRRAMRISLVGLDLLRGGSLYSATFGPSSYSQTWNPVYGRSLLLSVTWRFNSSGGTKLFPSVSF